MRLPICVAVAVMVTGCNGSGKPILFILPTDFRGEFHVVKDSAGGVGLVERNGEWVVEIPQSGVLRVKNDRPFYRWHATRFQYPSGRAAAVEFVSTSAGRGANGINFSTEYDGTTHTWRVR